MNFSNLFFKILGPEKKGAQYKIKYTICMLPSLVDSESGMSIMDVLSQTSQYEVFSTVPIQNIIEYKWNAYSFKFHILFAIIHSVYLGVFVNYINEVYLQNHFSL
jgi:hypothetical protein